MSCYMPRCRPLSRNSRRRLLGLRPAYVAGLLFAAHPIKVEAVAGIVGRAVSLCALAMIGAMILFMHRPMTIKRAIAICACLILALLSKEQGMLLPFLLLLLDRLRDWKRGRSSFLSASPDTTSQSAAPSLEYAPRQLHDPIRAEKFARQILTLLLCFTLAGYIFLRENILKLKFYWDRSFLDWTIQPMIRSTGADRWLMPLSLLGRYTSLLVAPLRLSIDYGGSAIGWTVRHDDPYLFLGVAAVLLWLLLILIAAIRRQGPLLFALARGAAMTYGVVGNLLTLIGTNFGERLMYLPSAFFILAITILFQRSSFSVQRSAFLLITLLFTARTITYAAKWNDRLSFYEYSLANQPRSVRLYMLLADENMKRGNLPEAERVDALGRALEPNYWDIYVQSAVVAEKLGKIHEADDFLHRAMVIRPSMAIVARRNELHQKYPQLGNPAAPLPANAPVGSAPQSAISSNNQHAVHDADRAGPCRSEVLVPEHAIPVYS